MKNILFVSAGLLCIQPCFAETASKKSPDASKLFETTSQVLTMDAQLRGMSAMLTFTKGNPVGDSIFTAVKAEWEKNFASNFSPQEIKYLDEVLNSALLKRYFKFNRDFANPATLSKTLNEKSKVNGASTKPKQGL